MDIFVDSLGGYDSWQFAALAFGSLFVGLGLYIWRTYLIPLVLFGVFCFYSYLNYLIEGTVISGPAIAVLTSTIPVLYFVTVLVALLGIKVHRNGKDKE